MTLIEKVNITTGTGWQMGLCVGNTGMLLVSIKRPTTDDLLVQAPPKKPDSLPSAYKTVPWAYDTQTTLALSLLASQPVLPGIEPLSATEESHWAWKLVARASTC